MVQLAPRAIVCTVQGLRVTQNQVFEAELRRAVERAKQGLRVTQNHESEKGSRQIDPIDCRLSTSH